MRGACLLCTLSPLCLTAQIKFHTSLPRVPAHTPDTHNWDKIKSVLFMQGSNIASVFTLCLDSEDSVSLQMDAHNIYLYYLETAMYY